VNLVANEFRVKNGLIVTNGDITHSDGNFTYTSALELLNVAKIKTQIILEVDNDTASSMSAGSAVYVSGDGTNPSVSLARADSSSTMPAVGIVTNNIGASSSGYVTINGVINISDTVIDDTLSDPGDVGKILYVSPTTAGNLTITKPTTTTHLIQNVGKIVGINGSNVKITISNTGRTNDVPNTISITGSITGSSIIKSGGTSSQFLKADGSVDSSSYSTTTGTVTSIDVSGGTTGLTFSGGPITSSGTITMAGTLDVDNGGTGQISYTDGQLLIGNTTGNTLAKATLTAGSGISITNGAGSIEIAATGGGGATELSGLTDVLIDATNFTDGILIQTNSDGSAPTTGTLSSALENIGIGKSVLTSLTSGDYNVAIGSSVLSSNTTGSGNVGIGDRAFNDSVSVTNGVAIGKYALQYSTASGNTAVGYLAGRGVSSGDANSNFERATFVGYAAGQRGAKSGQTWATAIGYNAGSGDIMGAYSTYVGGRAGYQTGEAQNNTAIGYYAMHGNSATTTGFSNNTAIGAYSIYGTSASSASNNVAVGGLTGYSLSTGDGNTLLGYQAGWKMTSGHSNVAVGFDALGDVTTGLRNIGIGYNAAHNFDTESDNIAIGYDALGGASLAGAEQNVVIGNYAGDAITSGDANVLIGHQAGTGITTGGYNVAIGYQAYDGTNTGSGNVAIGWWAGGDSANTGGEAVYIGRLAGFGVTSGNHNVLIGMSAGRAITTNANNTIIGSYAGDAITGASNVIVGAHAAGNASATTAERNTIVGNYAAGALTTGDKNIIVGDFGGKNITTGSNNVIIGGNIDAPSATGNDQLLIASGDGGITWIQGDSNAKVQIGDTAYNPSGITTGKLTVTRDETEGPDTGPTLFLVDGDSDANSGPILKMYRNTESPANGDTLGSISFGGEDSVGGERTYARIQAVADNVTSGSNDGSLEFRVFANGTQTEVMQLESDAQAGAKMTLMGVSQTGAVVSGTYAYLSLLEVATADHKAITASVHITDSTNNEVQTEMIVAHFDGTTVNYTTYGQIFDGNTISKHTRCNSNISGFCTRYFTSMR
jgi:hypothetical protein